MSFKDFIITLQPKLPCNSLNCVVLYHHVISESLLAFRRAFHIEVAEYLLESQLNTNWVKLFEQCILLLAAKIDPTIEKQLNGSS